MSCDKCPSSRDEHTPALAITLELRLGACLRCAGLPTGNMHRCELVKKVVPGQALQLAWMAGLVSAGAVSSD